MKLFSLVWNFFFERDPFGHYLFVKRLLITLIGSFTYSRFTLANRLKVSGTEHLRNLPASNVIFLSNHQTYYADVICFYHIFCSVKWGFKDTIYYPLYLLMPRVNMYYVAASETMNESGLIPRIFKYTGAITVQRSWRAKGQNVNREVDTDALSKIGMALQQGWVVSFPQGTTSPYAPIRKGTAHLIRELQPIVVPVVIDGFRRAFDKKGLFLKKRDTRLTVKFKPPMRFSPEQPIEEILQQIRAVIEQDMNLADWKK